jgi:hypothetical protein
VDVCCTNYIREAPAVDKFSSGARLGTSGCGRRWNGKIAC